MADFQDIASQACWHHGAQQVIPELAFLLEYGAGKTVVEVGSYQGGTLYAWMQVARRVISVDINEPGNLWGAEFVQGDSHDPDTKKRVMALLPGAKADLVFIDAWHGYSGVKEDWLSWRHLAPVVAFHDIDLRRHIETGETWDIEDAGVWKLWAELKDRHIDSLVTHDGWCGVGILKGGQ